MRCVLDMVRTIIALYRYGSMPESGHDLTLDSWNALVGWVKQTAIIVASLTDGKTVATRPSKNSRKVKDRGSGTGTRRGDDSEESSSDLDDEFGLLSNSDLEDVSELETSHTKTCSLGVLDSDEQPVPAPIPVDPRIKLLCTCISCLQQLVRASASLSSLVAFYEVVLNLAACSSSDLDVGAPAMQQAPTPEGSLTSQDFDFESGLLHHPQLKQAVVAAIDSVSCSLDKSFKLLLQDSRLCDIRTLAAVSDHAGTVNVYKAATTSASGARLGQAPRSNAGVRQAAAAIFDVSTASHPGLKVSEGDTLVECKTGCNSTICVDVGFSKGRVRSFSIHPKCCV